MTPTEAPDPDNEHDDQHGGLAGKLTDAVDTVKERIRQYHEGPHELD